MYAFDAGVIIGVLSGLAAATLGLSLFSLRPWRPSTVLFATFALLWGLQSAVANTANAAMDVELAAAWSHVNVALLIPLYVPLLLFAAGYPGRPITRPLVWASLLLPAVVLSMVHFGWPHLFIQGFALNDQGYPRLEQGPLFVPIAVANVSIAFVVALGVLIVRLGSVQSPVARSQLTLAIAGLLCYTMYKASDILAFGVLPGADFRALMSAWDLVIIWGAAVATLALAAALHLGPAREGPWRGLLLVATVLPFAVGVMEWYLGPISVDVRTVGVWRLSAVALLAYAISRHQLFDLEVRLARLVPAGIYVAASVGLVLAFWSLFGDALRQHAGWAITGTLAVPATLAPVHGASRRLVNRKLARSATVPALQARRIEVYHAALRATRSRVRMNRLRAELGIRQHEHRVLARLAALEGPVTGNDGLSPGQTVAQRYVVSHAVSAGAEARIYLAVDRASSRHVVLKQLRASIDDLRNTEAHLLQALHHPQLVRLLDLVDDPGHILVLEHMSGGDLAQRLEDGPLHPRRAAAIACNVLEGLQALHDHGYVHCDIKPSNILFDDHGEARLADLGAAMAGGSQGSGGTPDYMSPEQAAHRRVGPRGDIYAVGLVLHQMLTGRLPAPPVAPVAPAVPGAPASPTGGLSNVPQALQPVLAKALARQPSRRYASAAAFQRAITTALAPMNDANRSASPLPEEASQAMRA